MNYFAEEEEKEEKKSPMPLAEKIESEILGARRIFLCAGVDDKSAHDIIRKLWYLELSDPGKEILFVINSPGGSVDAGFAIWDTVQLISSPVTTLVTGIAASMGSILSLCASKGRRFATPHCRIMIHQPSIHGVIQGQATDLDIQAKEILKSREKLEGIYMEATGKTREEVKKSIDRDTWFGVEEAIKFGLLDGVINSFNEL